jgi:hypothetical protein
LEEVKAFRFHSNGIEATGFDDCIVASFERVRRWQPSAEVKPVAVLLWCEGVGWELLLLTADYKALAEH